MVRKIASLVAALGAVAAITSAAAPAMASTTGNYKGAGIEVSPTRVEIHLNAQGRATEIFTVADPGSKPALISLGMAPFHQKDTGQLALDNAPNLPGSVTGLSWVKATPSSFKLLPGQERKVVVHIVKPASASPGQRYVAVEFIATGTAKIKSRVSSRVSVAGELLIDTPGALRNTASYGLSLPSLSWGGPATLTASVKATGNDYVFLHHSHATDGGQQIRLPDAVTLAWTQRTITTSFTPGLGINHVTWQGKTATIIVLPGKLLLIALGALLLLTGLWFMTRRGRKQHLARARHGSAAQGGQRRKPHTA